MDKPPDLHTLLWRFPVDSNHIRAGKTKKLICRPTSFFGVTLTLTLIKGKGKGKPTLLDSPVLELWYQDIELVLSSYIDSLQ